MKLFDADQCACNVCDYCLYHPFNCYKFTEWFNRIININNVEVLKDEDEDNETN